MDSADLPIRFLGEISGGDFALFHLAETSGKTANTIQWTIQDLLLWKAVGAGQGQGEVMPHLAAYAGEYYETMREFRCPTTKTELRSVDVAIGRIEWPSQTGNFYIGCTCTLGIREYLDS